MADDQDFPSPQEMAGWLSREVTNATRASELRIKDAADFVTAYASGQITPEQAEERLHQYSKRWGDALPGITDATGLTDADIVKQIDEIRARQRLAIGKSVNIR